MKNSLIIFILLFLSSCTDKKIDNATEQSVDSLAIKNSDVERDIKSQRLSKYFDLHRLKASIEIINAEENQVDIQLGNHKIEWLDSEKETKIKIDNDLFSLKDNAPLAQATESKSSKLKEK